MSIYYEAVDAVQAIMTPSDQPIFKAQCILEPLLIKGIQSQDITIEILRSKVFIVMILTSNINFFLTEFQSLKTIVEEQKPSNTREIVMML